MACLASAIGQRCNLPSQPDCSGTLATITTKEEGKHLVPEALATGKQAASFANLAASSSVPSLALEVLMLVITNPY